jgi:hypothetical protein
LRSRRSLRFEVGFGAMSLIKRRQNDLADLGLIEPVLTITA